MSMLERVISQVILDDFKDWTDACCTAIGYDYGAEAIIATIEIKTKTPLTVIQVLASGLTKTTDCTGVFLEELSEAIEEADAGPAIADGGSIFCGYLFIRLPSPTVVFFRYKPGVVIIEIRGLKSSVVETTESLEAIFNKKLKKVDEDET